LPGVFGAGGLQALVKGGFPVGGKRVVVAGTGPLLLAVAAHLAQDSAVVSSVVEQASLGQLARFAASLWEHPAKLAQGVLYRAMLWKTSYRIGCWVVEAIAGSNGHNLSAVRVTDGTRVWTEPCDLLASGYHLVPNTEIAALLGCKFRGTFVQVDKAQRTSLPNVFCAGEPTGIAGLEAAMVQGEIAGLACAGISTTLLQKRVAAERAFGESMEKAFALRKELRSVPRPDTIVCRCEDVTFGSLHGYTGWTDVSCRPDAAWVRVRAASAAQSWNFFWDGVLSRFGSLFSLYHFKRFAFRMKAWKSPQRTNRSRRKHELVWRNACNDNTVRLQHEG